MTVFAVFEVLVDPDAGAEAVASYEVYRAAVPALIERFGGRYLVRAGTGRAIEGAPTTARWHIIEFPDDESAEAFWASPEYEAIKPLRAGAADLRAVLVTPPPPQT